jgi:hypothetical protein
LRFTDDAPRAAQCNRLGAGAVLNRAFRKNADGSRTRSPTTEKIKARHRPGFLGSGFRLAYFASFAI